MTLICSFQLLLLFLLINYNTVDSKTNRHRRQSIGDINTKTNNIRASQSNIVGSTPSNNVPSNPLNNPQLVVSNIRNDPQQRNSNNNLQIVPPQPHIELVRSRGFYNDPVISPASSFSGEKPLGWFGTNRVNWVSSQDSELDKHKLAALKHPTLNNPQDNIIQPRIDGGPQFLEKVAREYASKGDQAFPMGESESRGSIICSNFDNFNGFVFGKFACPLPTSTGMNPLDQFCCGHTNYQYCCNAQEFSQTQRGAFADHTFTGRRGFSTRTEYSPATKRILTIISPIAGFIVLSGIVVFVFLYYKKLRNEQNRLRRPSGATRLEDNYSVIPQEEPIGQLLSIQDDPQ